MAKGVCGICGGQVSYGFCRKCGARMTKSGWEAPGQEQAGYNVDDDPQTRLLRQMAADLATIKNIILLFAVLYLVGVVILIAAGLAANE